VKRKNTKAHDVFTFYVGGDLAIFFFFHDGLFSELPEVFVSTTTYPVPFLCSPAPFFILLIVYLLLHGFPFTRLIKTTFNVTFKDASV